MDRRLSQRIVALASDATLADGTPCRVVGVTEVRRLSEEIGVSGRQVEIAALRNEVLPARYLRNRKFLSVKEQIRLLESTVCIVGLGGLGGLVTETLARMGVGRFNLIDGDTFEDHNLNRQLLSTTDRLDRPKAEAAADRVARINPGIETTVRDVFLTSENASALLADGHLAVDCLDNIPTRFILQSAARQVRIPMVSAAVAGISGQVTTIYPEDRGLETIYGAPEQLPRRTGEETRLGCLAPGVNLVASLECAEILKVLLAKPGTLRNRLLLVDLTDYTFETLQLA